MSTLAQEVDATLGQLDPSTAAKFQRLVRDAVALVRPSAGDRPAVASLNQAYFDSVIGAFADLEFDRPPQGELPATKTW